MSLRNAIVLLSGGLDSATTLAIARSDGFACHCLTIDYGQRHRAELAAPCTLPRRSGRRSTRCCASISRPSAVRRSPTLRSTFQSKAFGPGYRSPTSRRATRSFCRWPLPTPKCGSREPLLRRERRRLFRLPGLPARVHAGVRGACEPRDQGRGGRPQARTGYADHRARAKATSFDVEHPSASTTADSLLLSGAGRRPRMRALRRLPDTPSGLRSGRAAGSDAYVHAVAGPALARTA